MTDNFSGINNIPKDYVNQWIDTAKDYLNGKNSVTRQEAKTIFDKLGIEVSDATLQHVESYDGKEGLSVNEFASIFVLLDGKLNENNKFHFDGYVEDKTETGYEPEKNIANEGTKSEIDNVIGMFHEISQVENVDQSLKDLRKTLVLDYERTEDKINFAKQQGWKNNSVNKLYNKDGKLVGRILINYYEYEGGRTPGNFRYRLEAFDTKS